MPTENEQLQPTPFESSLQETTRSAPPLETQAVKRWWLAPAFISLIVVALLVVFWLPDRVEVLAEYSPNNAPAVIDLSKSAQLSPGQLVPGSSGTARSAPKESTPWSDAQLAKLRKHAQDVLAQLLDAQSALEERSVEQWAPQEFVAMTSLASAADEKYRSRLFEEATQKYQEALDVATALLDGIPAAFAELRSTTEQFIESGNPQRADASLKQARAMDPYNTDLNALQQRIETLPALLQLAEEATAAQSNGELASAVEKLRAAVALDPLHRNTGDQLANAEEALKQRNYQRAMSLGYDALDQAQFAEANRQFQQAQQLDPESAELLLAQADLKTAEIAATLAGLKNQGARYEQQENWSKALATYQKAKRIDGAVIFAQDGLRRSQVREALDKRLVETLSAPLRLADEKLAQTAALLLEEAKGITNPGALLKKQISNLTTVLQQANTAIAVTLQSDANTDVVVYRVKRLGRFTEQQLTLRPGKYTAVGTRIGYRDVRKEFTVQHDQTQALISIVCTETI